MIGKRPAFREIVQINVRFVQAGLALGYGWMCWRWSSPEWWGFGLIGIICLAGGAAHLIGTGVMIVKLILRGRAVAVFESQGRETRADSMAGERDLKSRGMIR